MPVIRDFRTTGICLLVPSEALPAGQPLIFSGVATLTTTRVRLNPGDQPGALAGLEDQAEAGQLGLTRGLPSRARQSRILRPCSYLSYPFLGFRGRSQGEEKITVPRDLYRSPADESLRVLTGHTRPQEYKKPPSITGRLVHSNLTQNFHQLPLSSKK